MSRAAAIVCGVQEEDSAGQCRSCHSDLRPVSKLGNQSSPRAGEQPRSGRGSLLCSACAYLVGGDRYAEVSLSAAECDTYLRALAELVGGVPQYHWRDTLLRGMEAGSEESVLLELFARRIPWSNRYHQRHGGWLPALIACGVLPTGSERRVMGAATTASDGHACWSLGELHLDNWLHASGIPHTREPSYPESNMRADFAVGDTLVEYFGLTGLKDYDDIATEKVRLARRHRIKLVCIYPEDLENWERRGKQVARKLGYPDVAPSYRPANAAQIQEIFDRHGIDPTRWPHPVPAQRPAEPCVWEPDPFKVGSTRLRIGDLWSRQIRDNHGRELRHTPGVDRSVWRRLVKLRRKRSDAFDDEEIAVSNSLVDSAEAGGTPDYRVLWPLLDAEQSANVIDDLGDMGGVSMLSTALRWAYKCGEAEAALAILAELERGRERTGDFEAMVRGSLPRHGFAPDPVAAGLAARTADAGG